MNDWPPAPDPNATPIRPGWRITFLDRKTERLESGTVRTIVRLGATWKITTDDGMIITPDRIVAVTRMKGGVALEHWTTRTHGLDGMDGRLSNHSRHSLEEW